MLVWSQAAVRLGSGESERRALPVPVEREAGVLEELRRVDRWWMVPVEDNRR